MRAMVLRAFGEPLVWETWPDPICGPQDVVLEVIACGVCATDLKIVDGHVPSVRLPHIPGHEIVGRVVACGPEVAGWEPGDVACAHFYVPCGRCDLCRAGRDNLCLALDAGREAGRLGFEWPGGFAEYVRVPARRLVRVPSGVEAAPLAIAADAIATPLHALRQRLGLRAGEEVVLLGAGGGLGLHALQIAREMGARVIAVDRGEERLNACRRLGAERCVDVDRPGAWQALLHEAPCCDAVVDLAGAPELGAKAMHLLRPAGRYVIVGYRYGAVLPISSQQAMRHEWEVKGSRASTLADLQAAVELVACGRLQPVVSERFPLQAANEALADLKEGRAPGRVLLMNA